MSNTDQNGYSGRSSDHKGHYHNGSYYSDKECPCPLTRQ